MTCLVKVVFSKSLEQHLLDLNEVLNRFALTGLKLKSAKCSFGAQEVEYLGYNIGQNNKNILYYNNF